MSFRIINKVFRRLNASNVFQAARRILHPSIGKRIENFLKEKKDVFFVQIGSCDGVNGDPIHKLIMKHTTWKGIFIEPVKYNFKKLQENYGYSDRFIFENIAIANENNERKFYYIKEDAQDYFTHPLPSWYSQIGQFRKEPIIKNFGPEIEAFIIEENVSCVTFEELCKRNKVNKIDLLHIDTEGFDYQIISQVNFAQYLPLVILAEHKCLPAAEKELLFDLLKSKGYALIEYPSDLLALRKLTSQSSGR
ncbi:MAG: FkbM family methyltransferase [Omnitrophica bacterium]|nr:FkbM family methyltransferase [Candidatus Omnitrophota bacterium]